MSKLREDDAVETMRVDKWLWAASFLKPVLLLKLQLKGVKYITIMNVKVSKEIRVGMELVVQQGFDKNGCC